MSDTIISCTNGPYIFDNFEFEETTITRFNVLCENESFFHNVRYKYLKTGFSLWFIQGGLYRKCLYGRSYDRKLHHRILLWQIRKEARHSSMHSSIVNCLSCWIIHARLLVISRFKSFNCKWVCWSFQWVFHSHSWTDGF